MLVCLEIIRLLELLMSCLPMGRKSGCMGGYEVTNYDYMFANSGIKNVHMNPGKALDEASMEGIFKEAREFFGAGNVFAWNVWNISNMARMFESAELFNTDIQNWQVDQVTDMSYMFSYANNFNQDLMDWDVRHVKICQTCLVLRLISMG